MTMMELCSTPNVVSVATVLGNLGVIIWVVKKYTGKVDQHEQILVPLVETVKNLADTTSRANKDIDNLYGSRNIHARALVKINTIHRIKGCDISQDELSQDGGK